MTDNERLADHFIRSAPIAAVNVDAAGEISAFDVVGFDVGAGDRTLHNSTDARAAQSARRAFTDTTITLALEMEERADQLLDQIERLATIETPTPPAPRG